LDINHFHSCQLIQCQPKGSWGLKEESTTVVANTKDQPGGTFHFHTLHTWGLQAFFASPKSFSQKLLLHFWALKVDQSLVAKTNLCNLFERSGGGNCEAISDGA
jgi:hypothetical protein